MEALSHSNTIEIGSDLQRSFIKRANSKLFDFFFIGFVLSAPILVYGVEVFGFSLRLGRLFLVALFPIVFFRICKRPNVIKRDWFLIFAVFPFFIYSMISMCWSSGDPGMYSRFGGLFEIFFVYTIMITADLDAVRFYNFVKYYTLSSIIPLGFSCWQLANNIYAFSSENIPFQSFIIAGKYEVLESKYFFAGNGFSRLSSTFAEPVIFSNFLVSVLLLSFILHARIRLYKSGLLVLRILLLTTILLAVSKSAILSVIIGTLAISFVNKKYRVLQVYLTAFFLIALGIVSYFDLFSIFERLFEDSGHYEVLIETLNQLSEINYVFGEGLDSIMGGSTHRFLLSRIFEAGFFGLLFAMSASFLPIVIYFSRAKTENVQAIKAVCFGTIVAVFFGLQSYDFFIHGFTWICIGAVMSFYYSEKYNRLRKTLSFN